jgi:pimeloyl-ACP methyl ester carboxylesterase
MRFPYAEVEFRSTGELHDAAQQRAAIEAVTEAAATDILLLAHGWNNDKDQATRLYERLTDNIAAVRSDVPGARARNLAVVGLLWPSVKWADDDDLAGGGLSSDDEAASLVDAIRDGVVDPEIADRLVRLVPTLETSEESRAAFLEELRALLPDLPEDEDAPPHTLTDGDVEETFDKAGEGDDDLAGAEPVGGGAAGIGDFGRSILRKAHGLLNLTTYYTMKDRAQKVGEVGVSPLAVAIADAHPDARVNFAGHSFGARVVSAAAAQLPRVHSVSLLQGAFSHFGFARDYDDDGADGAFRRLITGGQLTGPVLVTHTVNDRAVGFAYAVASRLAGQQGAGVGGPDDRYGGLGRNGALKTPEAAAPAGSLLARSASYSFERGKLYNLKADDFIASHGAVSGREIANAVLRAIVS